MSGKNALRKRRFIEEVPFRVPERFFAAASTYVSTASAGHDAFGQSDRSCKTPT